MNINYYLLILTFKIFLIFNSESIQTKAQPEPDLRVSIKQDGEVIQLEAFKIS